MKWLERDEHECSTLLYQNSVSHQNEPKEWVKAITNLLEIDENRKLFAPMRLFSFHGKN